MQVARAWETSPGSASVTVGVVDSGVGPHPALTGRVLPGYNLTDPDHPDDTADVNLGGHGTAVAGIIASAVHDRSGIAGSRSGSASCPWSCSPLTGWAATWARPRVSPGRWITAPT